MRIKRITKEKEGKTLLYRLYRSFLKKKQGRIVRVGPDGMIASSARLKKSCRGGAYWSARSNFFAVSFFFGEGLEIGWEFGGDEKRTFSRTGRVFTGGCLLGDVLRTFGTYCPKPKLLVVFDHNTHVWRVQRVDDLMHVVALTSDVIRSHSFWYPSKTFRFYLLTVMQ